MLLSTRGSFPVIGISSFMLAMLILRVDASLADVQPRATEHRQSDDQPRRADRAA